MTDEVVVMEPGDERAQRIAKAMASQTASEILAALKEAPLSAAEIADRLSIPLTTLKYHVENLADAGLIEVVRTRWSTKGREVKVYGLTSKLLIVAPPVKDIRAILMKYAALFGVVVFATIVAAVVMPLLMSPAPQEVPRMAASYNDAVTFESAGGAGSGAAGSFDGIDPAVLAFFLGGITVVLALLIYEVYLYVTYYRRRKVQV